MGEVGWAGCIVLQEQLEMPCLTSLCLESYQERTYGNIASLFQHTKPAGEFVVLIQQLETKFSFLVIHPRAHYVQLLELEVP